VWRFHLSPPDFRGTPACTARGFWDTGLNPMLL
jgi:hypothetical protein